MQAAAGEQQTTTTRRHEHKTAVQGSLVDHLAGAPDCSTSNYYGGGVPRLCACVGDHGVLSSGPLNRV